MFVKDNLRSFLRRKARDLAWLVFNKLENNGNSNFKVNGESLFIDNLMKEFKARKLAKVVIFDVGSHLGEYAEMIIHKLNKIKIDYEIHLFEPQKACFSVLLNKFQGFSNIKLNNFGVSNRNGEATLFYDKETSGLASLYQRNLDYCNIQLDKTERIILKRLDEYIESNNIDHIHFIKLDIEGHELKALEGLGNYLNDSFIDYIQFEYGGQIWILTQA